MFVKKYSLILFYQENADYFDMKSISRATNKIYVYKIKLEKVTVRIKQSKQENQRQNKGNKRRKNRKSQDLHLFSFISLYDIKSIP